MAEIDVSYVVFIPLTTDLDSGTGQEPNLTEASLIVHFLCKPLRD